MNLKKMRAEWEVVSGKEKVFWGVLYVWGTASIVLGYTFPIDESPVLGAIVLFFSPYAFLAALVLVLIVSLAVVMAVWATCFQWILDAIREDAEKRFEEQNKRGPDENVGESVEELFDLSEPTLFVGDDGELENVRS